jgi:hypothetical protein
MRKEKKKEKRKALPVQPACPSFPRGWALGAEPFLSSRVTWAGPGSCDHVLSLFCVADEGTPHVSRVFHLRFVVGMDSNPMKSAFLIFYDLDRKPCAPIREV